jgi:outer membrane protein OmpA-like peptidoglycan-associated protein
MRIRGLVPFGIATVIALLLFAPVAVAQAQTKSPSKPSRMKALAGKLADTAATSAASLGADSLLGSRGNALAQMVSGGTAGTPCTPDAAASAMPSVPSMPTPGGLLVGAAKKRLFGKARKDTAHPPTSAAQVAAAAAGGSGTPCQPGAGGAQGSALKTVGSMAMAASPAGLAVTGAVAAAPHAGKALRTLNSRFRRSGESKESIDKALASGRLEVKGVTFSEGSDTPSDDSEETLTQLAEVLGAAEGPFAIFVAAETSASGAPDGALATRRATAVAMHLQVAGVPEAKLVVGPASLAPAAVKRGSAHVVIVRVPAAGDR